jgi:hypothetical protein
MFDLDSKQKNAKETTGSIRADVFDWLFASVEITGQHSSPVAYSSDESLPFFNASSRKS